jgi:hypothetical protein
MLRCKGLLGGVAVVAVLVLAMAEPHTASARSAARVSTDVSATTPSSGATDFSARRRRHYYRGDAAGLAIMGAMNNRCDCCPTTAR